MIEYLMKTDYPNFILIFFIVVGVLGDIAAKVLIWLLRKQVELQDRLI